jgi:hypothetical protein
VLGSGSVGLLGSDGVDAFISPASLGSSGLSSLSALAPDCPPLRVRAALPALALPPLPPPPVTLTAARPPLPPAAFVGEAVDPIEASGVSDPASLVESPSSPQALINSTAQLSHVAGCLMLIIPVAFGHA